MRLIDIAVAVVWIAGLLAFTGLSRAEGIVMSLPDGFVIGSSDKHDSCSPSPSYIAAGCDNTLKPSSDVGYSISVSSDNRVSRSLDDAFEDYTAAVNDHSGGHGAVVAGYGPPKTVEEYNALTSVATERRRGEHTSMELWIDFIEHASLEHYVWLIVMVGVVVIGTELSLNDCGFTMTLSPPNRWLLHKLGLPNHAQRRAAMLMQEVANYEADFERRRKQMFREITMSESDVSMIATRNSLAFPFARSRQADPPEAIAEQAAAREAARAKFAAIAAKPPADAPEEDVPEAVQCIICMDRKINAVYRTCGHPFCDVCTFAAPNAKCPTCRTPFKDSDVMPIYIQ